VIRVYGNEATDSVFQGSFIPYCNITQAQLSFHGHKDLIKFFVAVPGQPTNYLSGLSSSAVKNKESSSPTDSKGAKLKTLQKTVLVMSGGEGYVDFRVGDVNDDDDNDGAAADGDEPKPSAAALLKTERSHLIVWQVFTDN
jgi:mitogen-activated protein kinase 8 interacting protein 3